MESYQDDLFLLWLEENNFDVADETSADEFFPPDEVSWSPSEVKQTEYHFEKYFDEKNQNNGDDWWKVDSDDDNNISDMPSEKSVASTSQRGDLNTVSSSETFQHPRPSSPHHHMCQSNSNTIGSATKSSLPNHTLKQRTFGPVVQILRPGILPNSKLIANETVQEIKQTESKKKVPTAILREITRLRGKYKFKINQNWMGASNLSSHIQFLVYLGDSQSPAVPPIRINTPRDYPESSAIWMGLHSPDTHQFQDRSTLTDTQRDYKTFHEVLLEVMSERIENTEDCSKHHISDLLNIWESSIKQACRIVGQE